MTTPTFLIVGAPKAGTTSVARHLDRHPDVFVSNYAGKAKEPHYFSYAGEQQPRWAVQTWDAYLDLFDGTDEVAARGEKSTWYLYSETAAEQIRQALPDVRILMLLRDPVARAYSSWSYRVQMGWEGRTFEEAVQTEAERRAAGAPWDTHYVQAGLYAQQVQRYLDRFDRSQVEILLFEDFRADPDAVMERVYRFVGVDPDRASPEADTVHNATAFPRWSGLTRWKNHAGARALASALPDALKRPLSTLFRRANQRPRPSLDPAFRAELRETVRDDVRALSGIVGQDLESRWLSS